MTAKAPTLLRQMADRQGQKITARDAVALRMAASVIDGYAKAHLERLSDYGAVSGDLIQTRADLDALRQALTAALEVTA